jgi:hypothetical protein
VAAVDGADSPPVLCTMTCAALMVVELTVPSTRTRSPLVTELFETELLPFSYFVEEASSMITF